MAETAELSGLFQVVGFLDDSQTIGEPVLRTSVFGLVASVVGGFNASICQVQQNQFALLGQI